MRGLDVRHVLLDVRRYPDTLTDRHTYRLVCHTCDCLCAMRFEFKIDEDTVFQRVREVYLTGVLESWHKDTLSVVALV